MNVTWNMSLVDKEGFALLDYLNRLNFQPGKFFVVESSIPGKVQVYYVEKES